MTTETSTITEQTDSTNEQGKPYTKKEIQKLSVFMRHMNNVKKRTQDVLVDKELIIPSAKNLNTTNADFIELIEKWETQKETALESTRTDTKKYKKLMSHKKAATKLISTVMKRKTRNIMKSLLREKKYKERTNELDTVIQSYAPKKQSEKLLPKLWEKTKTLFTPKQESWDTLGPRFEKLKTVCSELNDLNETFETLSPEKQIYIRALIDTLETDYDNLLQSLKDKNTSRLDGFPATLLQQIKFANEKIKDIQSRAIHQDDALTLHEEDVSSNVEDAIQKLTEKLNRVDKQFDSLPRPHMLKIINTKDADTLTILQKQQEVQEYEAIFKSTNQIIEAIKNFKRLPNKKLLLSKGYKERTNTQLALVQSNMKTLATLELKISSKEINVIPSKFSIAS